jgi:serine phosphatase RsbU (regulator of sigma subunit)
VIARLIEAIGEAGPAAIGVDILMPEPDRLSPEQIAEVVAEADPALARRLARLESNDRLLADAFRTNPVVLGMAGLDQLAGNSAPEYPRSVPYRVSGNDPSGFLRHFVSILRSIDVLDSAASGHGLLSVDTRGGIVRQVPLVGMVGQTLAPALSVEMLRIASGEPGYTMIANANGVQGIGIGDLFIPTATDGSVWVHFSERSMDRFISAATVLSGKADPRFFERKLVLVGATGLGLLDHQATPIGERMPGIEIHAQLLEGIFDNTLLHRPDYVTHVERALLLFCGVILVLAVPVVRPRVAALIYVAIVGGLFAAGFILYQSKLLLLDVAWPAVAATLLFGVMLSGTLAESDRQRRALRLALQAEREAAARAAGELEAARRIQMGMLPPPSAKFYADPRFSLQALIEPAKSVGGDLYDFFKLDGDRLFFMVGDVAGKGLPASIFMAVSKALYKSTALRSQLEQGADIGDVMRAANQEIARDNPEMLFVTVFAGILDLTNGELSYCNAGHDPPYMLHPQRAVPVRSEGESGPPLCVMEQYRYKSECYRLQPGESLCAYTDGVTEAMNADNDLYGRQRLVAALGRVSGATDAMDIVAAVRDDVREFVGPTERSDDLTILALRWNGGTR